MRILHVNNVLPVEPLDGGRMRKQQQIDALAAAHDVWVIGRAPDAAARDALAASRPGWTLVTVPEPDVPGRNPVSAAVRALTAREHFDIVLVSGFGQWPGERAFGSSYVVLDIDSLDDVVFRRMQQTDATAASAFDVAATEALTRDVCRRADVVLACSDVDASYIRGLAPEARVEVSANGIDASRFAGLAPTPTTAVPTVTFTGFLAYWPNADACRFLMGDVLPVLRRLVPDVTLRIVGRVPSAEVVSLAAHHGVELHADVPDILPWFERSHVMVAPIRAGSGTRLKILEAFAARRPVVSTTIGCEGLDVQDDAHLLVADTADAFAAAVARVLTEAGLGARLTAAAHQLLLQQYERQTIAEDLRRVIASLHVAPPRGTTRAGGRA